MELHQLRAFLGVRDTGSATAAAARLGVRQSTVSAAIRALEQELAAQLFHRVGRGMSPTPAGHALVGPARRILRDCGQAGETLAAARRGGQLELAALSTVVSGPFSSLVSTWLGAAPGRAVRVRDLDREDAVAEVLIGGTAEIVCTRLPVSPPVDGALTVLPIGSWGWRVAFPPNSETVPEGAVTMRELSAVPTVLVAAGRNSSLERATARTPLSAAVVADQREARTSLMLAGVGATIVGPRLAVDAAAAGAHVRPLDPPFTQSVGLVFDPARLSPVARGFIAAAGDSDEGGAGG
ncbi:LysR family transcriptional regulator [Actinomadura algeriensis]|uniref:DNA-binding transcriptional LysR family regulator n=1 Tax=Actinomadura algeriensis TaxID=1679523 RepID=A0ABR9K1U5_9ACTN|nr:LysR family transcriptional regulator [Actinomadura algeriensis]MBE1536815.1 DNA-binding transcriptional LysR family regulator [Actinomadura algeriensis]